MRERVSFLAVSAVLCVAFCAIGACEEGDLVGRGGASEDGGVAMRAQFGIGTTTPPIVTPAIIITPGAVSDDDDAGMIVALDGSVDVDSGVDAGPVVGDCGDGVVSGDEVCDPGLQPCCSSRCEGARGARAVCRQAQLECDVEERCDGTSFECPDDEFAPDTVVCRGETDLCDATEHCTGDDPGCPDDGRKGNGDACNGVLGTCDDDLCCPGQLINLGDGTCGGLVNERMVFVTELDQNGAFGGVSGGDALCNSAAADANLNGTYHAWLSAPGPVGAPAAVNAVDRVTADQIARVDGVVVADSLDSLVSGNMLQPIAKTAWNELRDVPVWTGTNSSGGYGGNGCVSWASNASTAAGLVGDSGSVANWTNNGGLTCEMPAALYCFQDDCPGEARVDLLNDNDHCGACDVQCPAAQTCIQGVCGGRVFVTSSDMQGSIDAAGVGALVAADAVCNMLAAGALLRGTYRAWLSTPVVNAPSRVLDAPYFRTDGVQVSTDRAHLRNAAATPLLNPIDRTERGSQIGAGAEVWTSTSASGAFTTGLDCVNWSTNARTQAGTRGSTLGVDGTWTESGTAICPSTASLYCFQVAR